MFFKSPDPLMIMPFRGYASPERFFLKGRVLEDEGITQGKGRNKIHNLMDSQRRFESDEIAGATISIRLANNEYEVVTDKEGYFTLNAAWQSPPEPPENRWLTAELQLLDAPVANIPRHSKCTADVLYPSKHAACGIISDIDDTVLQTHVSSRLKLKMIYYTLFHDSHQRLPMEGIPELMRALEKGIDGERENPIFYVSDSPWNIYDLLIDFMEVQGLPRGPVLLRDYGLHMLKWWEKRPNHKLDAFRHILKMYPDLPFIMLGDTASKDADYYLKMADEFSGRILAVYIRHTVDTKNARRVAKLIEQHSGIDAVLIRSSSEIYDHAKGKGLLS